MTRRRIAALVCLGLVSFFLLGVPLALAQDPGDFPPPADTNTNPDSITSVVDGLRKVIQSFGDLGAIAGLGALVGLLTQLTKIGALSSLVPATARPWIAVGLGALGGCFASLAEGGSFVKAILSGIMAGIAAVGGNQLGGTVTPGGRAKKEAASAVAKALEGPTSEVQTHMRELKSQLETVALMPDKTARLRELAAAATRASNGAVPVK